jgi:cytochrome c-type biogenesis protein CcmH/NrfG
VVLNKLFRLKSVFFAARCYVHFVNELTIGLLGALLATNQPLAVSNVIQEHTGITVPVAADATERELHDVMVADDLAHEEVSSWIATNTISRTNLMAQAEFNRRLMERFDVVRQGYDHFLRNHPQHARGYLAYGSFLNDIGDEEGAKVQYENSRQIDPKNPAVWNNLANYYGEFSPVTNAFACYTEAIRLDPNEPVYYHNFATTVYLFRKDASEFYQLTEPQVFDKALDLYRQTLKLAPANFTFATDYAESYYGIRPLRTNDALMAWTNALNIASTDAEREGVQIHLARVKISAGLYDEARAHLASVTNAAYLILKTRLEKSLVEHQFPDTNTVPVTNLPAADTNVPPPPAPAPKLPDRRVLLDGH